MNDEREPQCPICEDGHRRRMIEDMYITRVSKVVGVILAPFWALAILWLLIALIKFGFS